MLKKLVSISLIIAILATLVRFTIPYLWYYSNYNYIASELCIHQHSLDHDCDGTCQLRKMVHEAHSHGEQQPAPPVDHEQRINLFVNEHINAPLRPATRSFQRDTFINSMASLWIAEPVAPPPQAG